jgi:hypothetical protein
MDDNELQSRVHGINVTLRVGYPLKLDAEQCRLLADYIDSLEAEVARLQRVEEAGKAALATAYVIVEAVTKFEWVEEYTVETPRIRTYIPRWVVKQAQQLFAAYEQHLIASVPDADDGAH